MYSTMYGIPVGMSTALPIWPWHEDIREKMVAEGRDYPNAAIEALNKGIIETALHLITGEQTNYGESYGPGGISTFKDIVNIALGNSDFLEIMAGPSGSVFGSLITTGLPVLRDIGDIFSDGVSNPKMTILARDLADTSRTLTSVNSAFNFIYALNTGRYISRTEVGLDEINTIENIMMNAFGIRPQAFEDARLAQEYLKETKAAQNYARSEIIKYIRRAIQVMNNDPELYTAYMRTAKIWEIRAGFGFAEQGQIIHDAVQGYENLFQNVNIQLLKEQMDRSFTKQQEQELK